MRADFARDLVSRMRMKFYGFVFVSILGVLNSKFSIAEVVFFEQGTVRYGYWEQPNRAVLVNTDELLLNGSVKILDQADTVRNDCGGGTTSIAHYANRYYLSQWVEFGGHNAICSFDVSADGKHLTYEGERFQLDSTKREMVISGENIFFQKDEDYPGYFKSVIDPVTGALSLPTKYQDFGGEYGNGGQSMSVAAVVYPDNGANTNYLLISRSGSLSLYRTDWPEYAAPTTSVQTPGVDFFKSLTPFQDHFVIGIYYQYSGGEDVMGAKVYEIDPQTHQISLVGELPLLPRKNRTLNLSSDGQFLFYSGTKFIPWAIPFPAPYEGNYFGKYDVYQIYDPNLGAVNIQHWVDGPWTQDVLFSGSKFFTTSENSPEILSVMETTLHYPILPGEYSARETSDWVFYQLSSTGQMTEKARLDTAVALPGLKASPRIIGMIPEY